MIRVDPATNRFPGTLQYPQSAAEQKASGLIANVNRSITGRLVQGAPDGK